MCLVLLQLVMPYMVDISALLNENWGLELGDEESRRRGTERRGGRETGQDVIY